MAKCGLFLVRKASSIKSINVTHHINGLNKKNYMMSTDTEKACDKIQYPGFPGGAVVENLPANAGDTGSSPGLGRSHMPQSS